MENIKFSVVIPAYNCAGFIGQAIQSVLNQSTPAHEILVIDDGSTDSTVNVVKSFPKIRLFSQTRQGVSSARNLGVRKSKGEWIAFLDADDTWHPQKLELYSEAIFKYPRHYLIFSEFIAWYPEKDGSYIAPDSFNMRDLYLKFEKKQTGWIYQQQLLTNWVLTSTAIIHRELFFASGMFDIELPVGEDWNLFLRASRLSPCVKISLPLTLYRQSNNSLSSSVADRDYASLMIEYAVKRFGTANPDGKTLDPTAFRNRSYHRHLSFGRNAVKERYYRLALTSFGKAIFSKPWSPRPWLFWMYSALKSVSSSATTPPQLCVRFDIRQPLE